MKSLAMMFACVFAVIPLTAADDSAKETPKPNYDYMMLSTLWVQNSGEYEALSYQAFNLARMRLDEELKKKRKKKPAIILDVDETVLDNAPFQARSVLDRTIYPSGWNEWVEEAKAHALPGAKEFLLYAKKRGVAIFYVTNRKSPLYNATLKNLKAQGLPVKGSRLFLRNKERSKKGRRDRVLRDYDVLLYFGDNLADFSEVFEDKSNASRNKKVAERKAEFGRKFIVLPNPMYGAWEAALYGGDYRNSMQEKITARRAGLAPRR